jgi:hypothetical protein
MTTADKTTLVVSARSADFVCLERARAEGRKEAEAAARYLGVGGAQAARDSDKKITYDAVETLA